MSRRQRRIVVIAVGLAALSVALALVLVALRETIVYFRTPSDVAAKSVPAGERFRLGGLVAKDSVKRSGPVAEFIVTDTAKEIRVTYRGLLPDLFREGQGVVTEGRLGADGVFVADTVLAKHDETYMPPEVAKALKDKGLWQHAPAAKGAKKDGS